MHIVFSTFGTYGDINPPVAIGAELLRRGHRVTLAAPAMFRAQAEAGGLEFAPVRPEQDPKNAALIAMIYDRKRGTERGLREFLYPAIGDSYADLLAVVQSQPTDLLVSSELSYAAPLVAEVTGTEWASYALAPFSFFSAYDPPVLPQYPLLSKALPVVPGAGSLLRPFGRVRTKGWCRPVYELREELGLERGRHPIFEGKHAPALVLALFSRLLGAPQPDWPENTVQPGFIFYDRDAEHATLLPKLQSFLDNGPPPLVFTLGSAAVLDPGVFWRESEAAARLLGMRAVLLVGKQGEGFAQDSETICCAPYAPYSLLFPRASAVVHQGGVGTTAQALAAGKPMLIMPYSHDQPDNARRLRQLGVAKVLHRERYLAPRVARAVHKLLSLERYGENAREVAEKMRAEDGLRRACDALEQAADPRHANRGSTAQYEGRP